METVKMENIKDPVERKILELLKTRGDCLYGNIIEQLHLSAREGQQVIFSLLSKGLIRHKKLSSNIELNVDLI
jgi:predicted transcriptional regulator